MARITMPVVTAAAVCVLGLITGSAAQSDPLAEWPMPKGFHRDASGCYVADPSPHRNPSGEPLPGVPDGRLANLTVLTQGFSGQSFEAASEPVFIHLQRAQALRERGDLHGAVTEYRRVIASPKDAAGNQESYWDSVTRMPLSALLVRLGDVRAARGQWSAMLRSRDAFARRSHVPQPAPVAQLAYGRLDLVAARSTPNWNPSFFDSGAGQRVVRGIVLAQKRRYDAAATEWRIALTCNAAFQAPHVMLGDFAAIRHRIGEARNHWVAALEITEPGPGDMAGITTWQYDAMAALLRFSADAR